MGSPTTSMSSATSPVTTRPRSALYAYQEQAARMLAERRQCAILLRPGRGKTAITLTALADLKVARTLVIAPSPIVERNVWGREAQSWGHTDRIHVMPLVGDVKSRVRKFDTKTPTFARHFAFPRVDVVSYENVLWLTDLADLATCYQAIVFDELSKMKAPGTKRFKRLRHASMEIPVRFGLTGSPVPNRLLELWGELFMVAGDAPLGRTYSGYRADYFEPENPYAPLKSDWILKSPALAAGIFARVKPHAFSLDEVGMPVKLPDLHVNRIDLPLPPKVHRMAAELAGQCRTLLDSGTELEALGASTLASRVRQLSSGAVYTGNVTDETRPWEEVHTAKIDALREIVDEQQGAPVLCFYWYQHELARLRMAFPKAREATDQAALDAWDRGEVPLLLAHPQSAGHGLNLQAGGSTVVWFTLPWSHELWEQGNGRLVRLGQKEAMVTAHVLLAGETDHGVLGLLQEKGATQSALMDALAMRPEDDPIFW